MTRSALNDEEALPHPRHCMLSLLVGGRWRAVVCAAQPGACVCPCLLGRCTDNVIGEDEVHHLVEVELARAPQLRAYILMKAAQVQPPTHVGKGIGIVVE